MNIHTINEISIARYGVSIRNANPLTALWVAEHILDVYGTNVFNRISAHRARFGSTTQFPEYGSRIFNTLQQG